MRLRHSINNRWALVSLVLVLNLGAALAAAPVALLNDLTWNMVKDPMCNGHYGIQIDLIFGNSVDATITRTFSLEMCTLYDNDFSVSAL